MCIRDRPSILENWVDWVLHPKWFFSYRALVPGSKFFKNYGYPVPGAMNKKLGLISITYGGPMVTYFNFSLFDNIPYRRIKKAVFNLEKVFGSLFCDTILLLSLEGWPSASPFFNRMLVGFLFSMLDATLVLGSLFCHRSVCYTDLRSKVKVIYR